MVKKTTYEIRIVKVQSVHEKEPEGKVINPETLLPYLENIRNHDQEHFVCFTLNTAGEIITSRVITIGLLNHSLVHPREIFRGAIVDNAASIIVAHNHPSGSLEPSSQDIAITRQLCDAGTVVGIHVLDHIIISKNGHFSLKEKGMM